jgi:hypothetical protein
MCCAMPCPECVLNIDVVGTWCFYPPAKAPAANSSESPGRKGVSTSPVSQKTMVHRIQYVVVPCCWIMADMCLSKCKMKLMAAAWGTHNNVG